MSCLYSHGGAGRKMLSPVLGKAPVACEINSNDSQYYSRVSLVWMRPGGGLHEVRRVHNSNKGYVCYDSGMSVGF